MAVHAPAARPDHLPLGVVLEGDPVAVDVRVDSEPLPHLVLNRGITGEQREPGQQSLPVQGEGHRDSVAEVPQERGLDDLERNQTIELTPLHQASDSTDHTAQVQAVPHWHFGQDVPGIAPAEDVQRQEVLGPDHQ